MFTVVIALVVIGMIWGFSALSFNSTHASTDDAYLTSDIVQITPQVAGSIVEIPVVENQHVKKGELLARLDNATYVADLEQAKANLANAQATVASSKLNVGLAQDTGNAQIEQAKGGVGQSDAAIAGAQADLKRIAAAIQTAQAQQNGAQSNIKSALSAVDAAIAARKRAVSSVSGAQEQEITAEAGVRSAEAAVQTALAGVRSAQSNVTQAQANYDKANKDAVRYATLYDQDAISAQTLDTANASAKSARAQVDSLQRQVEQAQSTVEARKADLDARKADLNARKADVTAAQDQVGVAEATVQQSRAMLAATRDAAAAAAATVNQNRAQYQSGQQAVGQQVAKRVQAVGVLKQAETAPKQVAVSQAAVSTNRTRIAQAQAAVRTAQINLNRTRLVAPFDGTISKKAAEVGQQLAVGQSIMALVPDNDIWVEANFKETQLKQMRVGQDVEVEVDALGSQKFHGHLNSISAGTGSTFALLPADNATGNFTKVVQRVPVKIVFDRPQKGLEQLRAGLSVIATVSTGK
jgi:membrane fusion protein (multidrug efflux system)